MGSLLLAGGSTSKRYIMPHARVMIHQPLIGGGGISGQASDIEIHAKEMIHMKNRLTDIYVKHTGKSFRELEKAMDRDHFMSAEQARDFGLVDVIVENRKGETKSG